MGASPQWTFAVSVSGLNTSATPSTTSSTCVPRSMTARVTESFDASETPTMLSPTSTTITAAPTTMSHGFVLSGSQKIER